MIVCHCKGITDRDLRRQFEEGIREPSDPSRVAEAGTDCGGCRPLIDRIREECSRDTSRPENIRNRA